MALVPFGKFRNSLKFDARDSGVGVQLGPVYGAGKWLAIRGNNQVITSTDGVNWSVPSPSNGTVLNPTFQYEGYGKSLKFLNGEFVFLVNASNSTVYPTYYILTSTDGLNWTKRFNRFTPSGGVQQGTILLDGLELGQANPNNNPQWEDIEYANGKYWIAGTKISNNGSVAEATIYSSTDLVNWSTAFTHNNTLAFQRTYSTAIRLQGTELIVGGYFDISGNTGQYPLIIRSANNGTNWSKPTQSVGSVGPGQPLRRINAIANNGSNWLAVGNTGVIFGNSGGTNWTVLTSPGSTWNLYAVEYFNSRWVVYGNKYNATLGIFENAIFISSDGSSWLSRTVPSTNGLTNATLSSQTSLTANSGRLVGYNWTTTDGATFEFVNYRIPNQQPYIDYTADPKWKNWKTIDFWVYIETTVPLFSQYPILSQWDGENKQWSIYLEAQDSGREPYVRFSSFDGTNSYFGSTPSPSGSGTALAGQWNHVRMVASGTTGAIYLNGVRSSTFTVPTQWPSSGTLNVGRLGNGYESSLARQSAYWLDEVMINSTAINSPSLTTIPVPTERWVNNTDIMLLLHLDYNYLDDNAAPITADSPLAAISTVQATAGRIRPGQAQLTSTATVTAQLIRVQQAQITLQAFASQLSTSGKIVSGRAVLSSAFVQSIQALRQRGISQTLTAQAQVITTAQVIRRAQVSIQAQAQLTTAGNKIRNVQANLTVQAFELAVAQRTGQGLVDITARFGLQVQAIKTAQVASGLATLSQLVAQADKLRNAQAQLASATALTADVRKFKEVPAALASSSAMLAQAKRTVNPEINLASTSALNVTVVRVLDGQANLVAFDTVVSLGSRTRLGVANLTVRATLTINTSVNKPTGADLQAFNTVIAVGSKISFDPYYTIIITSETRNLLIHKETRVLSIKPETRVNKIKGPQQ